MRRHLLLILGLVALGLSGCSFGDRSVRLRYDRPAGEPQIFRGISVILKEPEDLRPEPHAVVGSVRSGVGVETAEITTEDDVLAGIHQAMKAELQQAGFHVALDDDRVRALVIKTGILELECVEGIGFGGKIKLEIRVAGDATLLLKKTYASDDRHLLITKTSGNEPADSLRTCLKRILSQFAQDLVLLAERSPD